MITKILTKISKTTTATNKSTPVMYILRTMMIFEPNNVNMYVLNDELLQTESMSKCVFVSITQLGWVGVDKPVNTDVIS